MRDIQKNGVYLAERVLVQFPYHFKSLNEIQAFVDGIITSEWWTARSSSRKVVALLGRKDSGRAFASGPGQYNGRSIPHPFIVLPGPWAATKQTVLHELAHILDAGACGHGPSFCRAHIDLVAEFLSRVDARELEREMRRLGIQIEDNI